ncbi:MAG: preprotein translocase subunit YajC [Tyzzerella sp.]|uniref:Preprotein translocase subunit YajC n=1 Tax=Candidatus Fimicola merdigallinarum TaxID=2840819 RepID=A0A9D9H496_9FIRM|nr:preprotein translocase subunit YajC [Candidatus Fimicola merdigallinarum]
MSNPIMMIVVYCVVIFGALYFFSIRPQKKREAEAEAMRSTIKVGDSVLLNNGMYGVIADITAECYIVEFGTNKGIRIPVLKQEVALIRTPNLSNKEPEPVVEEKPKKSFLGFGKKED